MNSTGDIADTPLREKKHKKKSKKRAEPEPDIPSTRDSGKIYQIKKLKVYRLLSIILWIGSDRDFITGLIVGFVFGDI